MAGIFGSQPKVIPEFTGLQVNTSVQVLPIPIIYGSPRIPINLIYYNGFNVQQVKTGGKGILSGGKGQGQTEYFATIILAVGEGPIANVKIIYQDQNVWTPTTYPTNGAAFFNGDPSQAPWSYVVANWPDDARGYNWTSYYAFPNAQLSSSATVPQINLVLEGFFTGSSPLNNSNITITTGQYDSSGNPISFMGTIPLGNADADPAQVIYDFMTNPIHGATFPKKFVNDAYLFTTADGYDPAVGDGALSTYCQAIGLAWSVVVNNAESANSAIDRWCKNLGVAPVWDGATLKFIPYWDRYESANYGWDSTNGIPKKYFSPFTISIVTVPLDQILQSDSQDKDPITFTRKDPMEVYNTIRVNFKDRNNFFNDSPVEAKDEAHIDLYGPRTDNIGLASEFSLSIYAFLSATIQLRRNISIMRTFTWKMGPLWGWLDPMDVINIPDPSDYSKNVSVRIISVEDDEEEVVTFVAEEFPVGAQSPTTVPAPPTTPPNQGALNVPCSPAYPPLVFTPPTAMLTATGFSSPQWIFGDSGGNGPGYAGILDPNWGGVNVWVSLDNVNYQQIGVLTRPSTIGATTQALPGYGGINPDTTDTLYVNLNECDGALASVDASAAAAGHSICVIQDLAGFEILAYETATLVGPHTYALTNLYRGLYGTTSRLFSTGSRFLYVGSTANIFETALPPGYIGKNAWVKPQAFNSLGNYVQDLASVIAYPFVVGDPNAPPTPILPPMPTAAYRRLRRNSVAPVQTRRSKST